MLNTRFIDELTDKIHRLISSTPAAEIENDLRALLQSVFARLDLVTREEFDVQSQVLLQSRARLEALERKLDELEARLGRSD
ncbi:MAG: accessory factor UbiK family protein [Methylophilaceae bacterium]|nr:accessory factor UbiK family protein [Methylophilaceae bacterium]